MKIQPVRGTHDVFGKNISKYNKICEEVDRIARLFSFLEIQTPIFESTNLFSKPLGEASDVVLKEMYTFLDKSGDTNEFTDGIGCIFGNEKYKKNPKINTESLFSIVKKWINVITKNTKKL